jgi:hypothetical protein
VNSRLFDSPFIFVENFEVLWQPGVLQQKESTFFAHGSNKAANPWSDLISRATLGLVGSEFPHLPTFLASLSAIISKGTAMEKQYD